MKNLYIVILNSTIIMVPQAWFVLCIFIISVLFSVIMTAVSPYYRAVMFNNSTNQMAYFFITIMITAILMLYSAQCSIVGSKQLPMCGAFSWVIVSILTLALALQIGYGVYAHASMSNNMQRSSASDF